jgi:hypothetical protein
MFSKSVILEVCNASDVVRVTFTKASGEVTTRRTSFKAVPGELEGKGMRSFKEAPTRRFSFALLIG